MASLNRIPRKVGFLPKKNHALQPLLIRRSETVFFFQHYFIMLYLYYYLVFGTWFSPKILQYCSGQFESFFSDIGYYYNKKVNSIAKLSMLYC